MSEQVRDMLSELLNNKPFVIFMMTFIRLGLGIGLWYGLSFVYADTYLNLGAEFSELSL